MHRLPRFFFLTIVIALLALSCGTETGKQDIMIGEQASFYSEQLGQRINLLVSLPENYDLSEQRYPVLYALHTNFWHNAGTVRHLGGIITPGMIYVQLETYNSGDFLPSAIESRPGSGGADSLIKFFEKELIPFVNSEYRTQPFTLIHSGSWGGVFAVHALLSRPDLFNGAIASTPWVIYDGDGRFMRDNVPQLLADNDYEHNFLYIALGNDPDPGLRDGIEYISETVSAAGKAGLRHEYRYWDFEDHFSIGHKAVHDGLRWIFRDWQRFPDDIAAGSVAGMRQYSSGLTDTYGYDIGINPRALYRVGMGHIRDERYAQAIAAFKYGISLDSGWPVLYSGLGRAYEAAGDPDSALVYFRQAYDRASEISFPDLARFQDRITRLEHQLDAQR
ncbi:MAG: alpha/beta hydrolase-fold protein [Candidatus Neomarinimicrobiota bacterium]